MTQIKKGLREAGLFLCLDFVCSSAIIDQLPAMVATQTAFNFVPVNNSL
jgi:hypothetical protein